MKEEYERSAVRVALYEGSRSIALDTNVQEAFCVYLDECFDRCRWTYISVRFCSASLSPRTIIRGWSQNMRRCAVVGRFDEVGRLRADGRLIAPERGGLSCYSWCRHKERHKGRARVRWRKVSRRIRLRIAVDSGVLRIGGV